MSVRESLQTSNNRMTRRSALGGLLAGTVATGFFGFGSATFGNDVRLASTAKGGAHPLNPAIGMARESLDALKKVKDYTANFYKDELVGSTRVIQEMQVKIRETPFSAYLRFVKDLDGREVIYVDGKNEGKALIHGSGIEKLVGTLKLAPNHKKVMEENRYPLTMLGLNNMMKSLVSQWEGELTLTGMEVKLFPNATIENVACKVYQSTHAKKQAGAKFHITRLYIDKATSLPVRVEQLDFPAQAGAEPVIVEQYTYLNLKTNVGLTDADFDPKNKSYSF